MKNYNELQNLKTIVVHDGVFHADDTSCCAFMRMINPEINILRTNDVSKINQDEAIICDIGKGEFDHHQTDGSVPTVNVVINDVGETVNTKRCAFGRLWEAYGKDYLNDFYKNYNFSDKVIDHVFDYVKEHYVKYIDYLDNNGGYKFNYENLKDLDDTSDKDLKDRTFSYTIFNNVRNYNPNFLEELKNENKMINFANAIELDDKALRYNICEAVLDYNDNVENVLDGLTKSVATMTKDSAFKYILATQDNLAEREQKFFENFDIVRDEYNKYRNSETKVEFQGEKISIADLNKKMDGNVTVVEKYFPLNYFNFDINDDGYSKECRFNIPEDKNTVPVTHFLIFPSNRGAGYTLQSTTEVPIPESIAKNNNCTFWHAGSRLSAFDTIEDAVNCANEAILDYISDAEMKFEYHYDDDGNEHECWNVDLSDEDNINEIKEHIESGDLTDIFPQGVTNKYIPFKTTVERAYEYTPNSFKYQAYIDDYLEIMSTYEELENAYYDSSNTVESDKYHHPTLYFAFGPSGAGKSYFCNELNNTINNTYRTCLHITSDGIRESYAKEQYENGNPLYANSNGKPIYTPEETKTIFAEMTKQIIDGLNKGIDVISDRVITTNELKFKFLDEIIFDERLKKNINVNLIQITNTKENCLQNVENRNKLNTQGFVPLNIVEGMYDKFEKMEFNDILGFDERYSNVSNLALTQVDKNTNKVTVQYYGADEPYETSISEYLKNVADDLSEYVPDKESKIDDVE